MAQAVPGVRPVIFTAGRVFVKSCVIGVPGVLLTLGVQRTSYAFAPSTATSATSSWPLFLPGGDFANVLRERLFGGLDRGLCLETTFQERRHVVLAGLLGVTAKPAHHLYDHFLLMITFGNGLLAAIERCRDFHGQRVDGAFERGFVDGWRRIVRRISEARKDGVRIRQVSAGDFLL